MMGRQIVLMLTLAATAAFADELAEIRKETDHLRRFERAIELAETQSKAARQLIRDSGSRAELQRLLSDVEAASILSLESLRDTGKKPAKLTRQYKKGEQKTAEMVRTLKDLVLALSVDDKPEAEKVRDRVDLTHEEFLLGVMSGK